MPKPIFGVISVQVFNHCIPCWPVPSINRVLDWLGAPFLIRQAIRQHHLPVGGDSAFHFRARIEFSPRFIPPSECGDNSGQLVQRAAEGHSGDIDQHVTMQGKKTVRGKKTSLSSTSDYP